jgi:hypothetical protein
MEKGVKEEVVDEVVVKEEEAVKVEVVEEMVGLCINQGCKCFH